MKLRAYSVQYAKYQTCSQEKFAKIFSITRRGVLLVNLQIPTDFFHLTLPVEGSYGA